MPKRKFVYSKTAGKVVEVTNDEVKSLCDEITESIEPYKGDWNERCKHSHEIARWPYASDAMGVRPEDIPRAQAILAEHGVKTEYTETGEAIMRDKAHRKAHCRALGFWDRDAGYSDPEPLNFTMDYHPDQQRRDVEQWIRETMGG